VVTTAWNFSAEKAIYTQIKDVICTMIATGRYAPGQKFPAVREIAADAGVNPNTMQKALAELEADGYLCSNRTSGRTVSDDSTKIESLRVNIATEAANSFLDRMNTVNFDNESSLKFLENIVIARRA
jgi:DNA-binding transcriptional regulator YhcF (GntR family)